MPKRYKILFPSLFAIGIVIVLGWYLTTWYLSASCRFSPWLGPQSIEHVSSLGQWQQDVESIIKHYNVAVSVEAGKNIKIPSDLEDPIVVCAEGKIIATETCHIDPNRKYVVGIISLSSATGWRIYSLNARVTKGPLKGALILNQANAGYFYG